MAAVGDAFRSRCWRPTSLVSLTLWSCFVVADACVAEPMTAGQAHAELYLARVLRECALDLFAHYDTVLHDDSPLGSAELVAVVGYHGIGIRGSLGISVDRALLLDVNRRMRGERGDQKQLVDVIAELSTRLLGRFRARLEPHGLAIVLSTPMVIRGLRMEMCGKALMFACGLSAAQGGVSIWLDGVLGEALPIAVPEAPAGAALGDREVLAF